MEEWREVPSFIGFEASSFGRIRRKTHEKKMPNGGVRKYDSKGTYGCVRRSSKTAKHAYMGAAYRDIGNIKIHRLVCGAFHGKAPSEKSIVIHINENGCDNRPENLAWGTQKENLNMPGFIDYCKSRKGSDSPRVKGSFVKKGGKTS